MAKSKEREFLPVSKEDMESRSWYYYDFLIVTGDAYVDHPSFGTAIIARLLESLGFRVAVLAQPQYRDASAFLDMGKPRFAVMISAGNIDSMVAHYTVAKRRRNYDAYSPGGKAGFRPDRATIVYSNRAREAFPDTPIIIGGLEASLRRFCHYDYWSDKVRRSMLIDSGADLLTYGMGERQTAEIANRLKAGEKIQNMTDIRGTCFLTKEIDGKVAFKYRETPSFEEQCSDKKAYAEATRMQHEEQDHIRGLALCERNGNRYLVQNPPALPLDTERLDRVYELPYMRAYHPMYESAGGVPAIKEVEFSITHNRGCFGACNFCSLAFHQGRYVTSRSHESVVREAKLLTKMPNFKGYIHDVGGPTANFRAPACDIQKKNGLCRDKRCLAPKTCKNIKADHSDYLELLRKLRGIEGVKKVFIRSGIRYDYMLCGGNDRFFDELVRYHVSGQIKVAPEHVSGRVLDYMGKPHFETYLKFKKKYEEINEKYKLKQFIVPYLMSSHPGSTLEDAVMLAEFLHSTGHMPEQVQDFYPTPGTISTAMYYTEIDPRTMKKVFVPKNPHEKAMQRALLQWKRPQNRQIVIEALKTCGRSDLIGFSKGCLVPPRMLSSERAKTKKKPGKKTAANPAK